MTIRTRDAVAGALAGALATIPMTVLMVAGHRRLPLLHRDPLPPGQITDSLLAGVSLHDDLSREQKAALALLNHFAYGAAMGLLFGALDKRSPLPRIASGIGYGLLVWAGNYLVLLPSLGLYRSAANEPRERNLLMLAAHVVWGASLGAADAATLSSK